MDTSALFIDTSTALKHPAPQEADPVIKMWYIRAQDTDGDDLDLIVRAATEERAIELWKEHFTDDYTDLPEMDWIGKVPSKNDEEGVVAWGDIM